MMLSEARSRRENSIGPKSLFRMSEQRTESSFSAIWDARPRNMSSTASSLFFMPFITPWRRTRDAGVEWRHFKLVLRFADFALLDSYFLNFEFEDEVYLVLLTLSPCPDTSASRRKRGKYKCLDDRL